MATNRKDTMIEATGDHCEELPADLRALASRIESMPSDTPEGLEGRVFEASVRELDRMQPTGIVGRLGPARRLAPLAAAAVVGLLAWAGWAWLSPSDTVAPQPQVAAETTLDEHVDDVLAYADLFAESSWDDALAEDADALEQAWEPTVDSWSLEGELGAS